MENIWDHFGNWPAVVIWVIIYGVFLAFVPFYRKSQVKPSGVYAAFVIAFALEMFGIPMSMYALTWLLGRTLPEGVLWGHTLIHVIGYWGMYIGAVVSITGMVMVILGWREIHKRYWSREQNKGELVTTGIYARIRHPQYTGFLLITLGMLLEWATPLPLLIMWPILAVVYYQLARREERDMIKEFGEEYLTYMKKTKRLIPFVV